MVQTTGEKVGKENGAGELMRETVVTFKQAHAQEVGEIRVEKKGSLKLKFCVVSRKMEMGDCC